jgi:hypothetical protein
MLSVDFHPTREQIETIVDMVTARMPSDAIARALGLESGEFMTWGSCLAKTRSLDLKIRNPELARPLSFRSRNAHDEHQTDN